MDKYKKDYTYLVLEKGTTRYIRWTNKEIFYAGSIEDALEGLPKDKFTAILVADAPQRIQTEYKKIIDRDFDNL